VQHAPWHTSQISTERREQSGSIRVWSGRLTHRTTVNVPDTVADFLRRLENDNVLLFYVDL
jgi:hypothetical protein